MINEYILNFQFFNYFNNGVHLSNNDINNGTVNRLPEILKIKMQFSVTCHTIYKLYLYMCRCNNMYNVLFRSMQTNFISNPLILMRIVFPECV